MTRSKNILGFAMLVAVVCGSSANAQTASASSHVLQRSGSWTTSFESANGSDAQPASGQCVIARQLMGRGFLVRGAPGGGPATVQIFRDSWRIPADVRMNVAFDVDGRTQWIGQFAALPPDKVLPGHGRETVIEAAFPNAELALRFLSTFASGRLMTIRFLEGNEGAWRAPLDGSSRAVTAYSDCLRASGGTGGSGTQPFNATSSNGSSTTQPFNAPAN